MEEKYPKIKETQSTVHSRINTALLDVVQALFVPGFPTGVLAHPETLFVFWKLADVSLIQRRKCSHIRSSISFPASDIKQIIKEDTTAIARSKGEMEQRKKYVEDYCKIQSMLTTVKQRI